MAVIGIFPLRTLVLLLSLVCASLSMAEASERTTKVLIVTSELNGVYGELISALRSSLKAVPPDQIVTIKANALQDDLLTEAHCIVTVGTAAASALASRSPTTPTLNTLLPRDSYVDLINRHPGGRLPSAIYIDQPVSRQLALIAEALPEWQRLALIFGASSRQLAEEIFDAAAAAGYEVTANSVESDREIYPALQDALSQPAILLALPDRAVFNSHTIQNILLTSYRQRSPLIGFSPAYVRAGALLSLYSTPAQIGTQAASTVLAVLAGDPLPPARYPDYFVVGANSTVARSLGIRLDTTEQIASRIRQRESAQ